ncbi:hypothetical protein J1N35_006211 [Gossypium stocksii]|uniref:Uncharacterized protein n=1 Tax=Gossypium stocksii TaxID=47602 RepID=A0A9D4AK24_9ROSI|nr:hypothetical protein J1N35_006211 [Gossypium stocksii]
MASAIFIQTSFQSKSLNTHSIPSFKLPVPLFQTPDRCLPQMCPYPTRFDRAGRRETRQPPRDAAGARVEEEGSDFFAQGEAYSDRHAMCSRFE